MKILLLISSLIQFNSLVFAQSVPPGGGGGGVEEAEASGDVTKIEPENDENGDNPFGLTEKFNLVGEGSAANDDTVLLMLSLSITVSKYDPNQPVGQEWVVVYTPMLSDDANVITLPGKSVIFKERKDDISSSTLGGAGFYQIKVEITAGKVDITGGVIGAPIVLDSQSHAFHIDDE